jgi:hypothetical protein
VADPVDEPVDAPSPSRDEFIPAGHADTTVPDASRGVSEEVRSEPVVPQAQRLLTEFVWTEYAGGLLQPERPDADRGWRAIVGFVVAGPIANAIPADLEAARRWARDAGLTVIDCTDPAAGAVRLLVAGVKPSGGESPAGLSSEPLSRRAELPSIAAECVVGLLAPVGVSRAGSFDVRALDASGQLLDGVPPGSTTRLSDGEGRILEVIRVPLRPELGEVTLKFAFNDRVLKVGPFTIRHVQASEAEGEVVR